jgi:transposase
MYERHYLSGRSSRKITLLVELRGIAFLMPSPKTSTSHPLRIDSNRFRTKRQLWAYCGLALRTYTSGEYRFVAGQLKRSKKVLAVRGLNINHNHDLKNIFKGAATRAAATAGPLQDCYQACVARGVKPHLSSV